jgi:hypothetical protein
VKRSISSPSPPLSIPPGVTPPRLPRSCSNTPANPPLCPAVCAAVAPLWGRPLAEDPVWPDPPSHSAILSLFWYPATASNPSRAVIDGNPRLIVSFLSLLRGKRGLVPAERRKARRSVADFPQSCPKSPER